jgi:capsular polysaccharide transport system permease protein
VLLGAAYNQLRVIGALLLREAGMRGGKSLAFGFISDAVEPLMIIAVICFFRWVLGSQAKYGTDVVLFTATGVFPSWTFVRTSVYVSKPVAHTENPHYPIETNLDRILAAAVLHLINTTLCAMAFFTWLYNGYHDPMAMPYSLWQAIQAMFILFTFGLGVGLTNSVIGEYVPVWSGLWAAVARGLMHFSAIFFVADFLPPNLRALFAPNPVLHGVNWFRHAFYPTYPNVLDNHQYIMVCTLVALPIGLLMVQMLERRSGSDETGALT